MLTELNRKIPKLKIIACVQPSRSPQKIRVRVPSPTFLRGAERLYTCYKLQNETEKILESPGTYKIIKLVSSDPVTLGVSFYYGLLAVCFRFLVVGFYLLVRAVFDKICFVSFRWFRCFVSGFSTCRLLERKDN